VSAGLAVAGGQTPNPILSAPLTQLMPVDPQITVGTLPNGLRYYVRANAKPDKRAELRLVVRAGSVLEDDDQQGLAHLVEHLAFNGTLHFPGQSVQAFLSSVGMSFGADANAATTFDTTTYRLRVPTDNPVVLDRALLVLEDWAHGVSFDDAAIEKERGVVMEEWRLHLGAAERVTDKAIQAELAGSRYADRLPIGKTEIIQHGSADRLRQFYRDWYRPDLMAVVVVGDFDRAAVEALVKKHFAPLSGPAAPRPRPAFDVPDHAGTTYVIATDKETTASSVQIESLLPLHELTTVGAYRQKIVDRLFTGILNARYAEITQRPDAPFVLAAASRGFFTTRTRDMASLRALVAGDDIDRALDALLAENERVARFGFTATELDRQKQNTLRSYEGLQTENVNRESASRADEYIRNFLEQETLPTIADEYALQRRFLSQITLAEVNALARDWFPDRNRFVIVTAPDKAGVAAPNQAKLAAVIAAEPKKDLKPYVDTVDARPLLDTTPRPGTVVKTAIHAAEGVTEWELSNGARVVLAPTTLKEDEIVFRATSPGGTSLASDADYFAASLAAVVVSAGGVGRWSTTDLRKELTGRIASASPVIGDLEEGLSGSSSRRDLETLLQLVYMRFTQPRADPAVFAAVITQSKAMLANLAASPDLAFTRALSSALSQDHPRLRPPTEASFDQLRLDTSLAFYRDRFADAGGFTFVFAGSFDVPTMRPLVERYLGSLPSTRRRETWRDVGVRTPPGIVEKTVEQGVEPKSRVAIVFTGPLAYDEPHHVALEAMSIVLQSRLVATIREQLGGTYSITTEQTTHKFPRPEYEITIQWTCDPERTAGLAARVLQEVAAVKALQLSEWQMGIIRDALQKDFETNSQRNGFLAAQMTRAVQAGEDVTEVWHRPEAYRQLTAAAIHETAQTTLDLNRYVKVVLMPEKK
jgi:zinc protease